MVAPKVSLNGFQFTPLREGRPGCKNSRFRPSPVSIHAPARGATPKIAQINSDLLFQFTPLREGRLPSRYAGMWRAAGVSIHAPARGATGLSAIITGTLSFQFTPLREGRHPQFRQFHSKEFRFNSRPCERGDEPPDEPRPHATSFNSRPCERGDEGQPDGPCAVVGFQFTPLREGRL